MAVISRRSFLKGSLATLAASTLSAQSRAEEPDQKTLYDCIVIGAGPSGLTAARNLSRMSVGGRRLRVLVLEGNDRIGGRLFTDYSRVEEFGAPLERGAEYIHMAPGAAPIWNEVDRYGLEIKTLPKMFKGYLYNSEFLAPVPHSPLYSVAHLNLKILKASGIFKDIINYRGPDISVARFIRKMDYEGFAKESALAILSGHLGTPPEQVSIKGFQADHFVDQLKGLHEYYVKGGYDSIFKAMMKELPAQSVLFNQSVQSLRLSKDGCIQVQTAGGGRFVARTVLCTAAIGMLHSRSIDFGSFWTDEKEASLGFIKPSQAMKISIRFKDRFWDEDMCMLDHLEKSVRMAGTTYFVPNYKEPDKPPVLTALLGGDDIANLSSLSADEVLRRVCHDLTEMFKLSDSVVKKIAKRKDGSLIYVCKNWVQDPFAKGGTSSLHLNSDEQRLALTKARAALGSSVNTKPLFWAGEATSTSLQPSSVHGAHATGLRATTEIYNYLARRL